MTYYTDRNLTKICLLNDDGAKSSEESLTLFYTKVPENLTHPLDEPEIDRRYHQAIVDYVLSNLVGGDRHYRNYLDKVRWARSVAGHDGPITIRRYDY